MHRNEERPTGKGPAGRRSGWGCASPGGSGPAQELRDVESVAAVVAVDPWRGEDVLLGDVDAGPAGGSFRLGRLRNCIRFAGRGVVAFSHRRNVPVRVRVVHGPGIEGREAGRGPCERGGVRRGGESEGRVSGRESPFHRLGEIRLLVLRPRRGPGRAQGLARHREDPVLADPGPEHVRARPDMGREVDVEADGRGFQLGPGVGLKSELALDRARDRGREERLLLRLRKRPQGGEGLAVVLMVQPVQ